MKSIFLIIIISFQSFWAASQNNGVNISFQYFDFSNPKSNITNNWSWLNVNYCRNGKGHYSFDAGINVNTSYFLSKSIYLFNPIPRGKNIFENLGLSYTNKYTLKTYNDNLSWGLSNQINFNPTRIYSTYIDSTGAGKNIFTDKFLLFRIDLGLSLKAKIVNNLFFGFTPAIEYFRFNSSDFGISNGFRGKMEFSLIWFPKFSMKE